ncbi:uncharacterized protein BO88DRAFT_428314 [Aspergillus vadensis CBS 113365]|uniref:Uncharacterized protein n=1 Tax=Aspergillus vadensis (strain CBS 113365 / IMI 142717 / IBT 24658) TaxID=1448311 RepID=A0A319B0E2_ASPVC|nr:hypothetical protein BO88DRAFT_428314 [Aspergillus vadensis CBS 113365]PYH65939.1 hypothetical protein BO88DRAFT_428314 [Aspergillus vadensis CBS 113365]
MAVNDSRSESEDLSRYEDTLTYSHIMLPFAMPEGVSQDTIVADLEAAVRQVRSHVPGVAGKVDNRYETSEEGPFRIIRLQASSVEGGVFLDFVTQHNLTGAGGFFNFARHGYAGRRMEQVNRDRRNLNQYPSGIFLRFTATKLADMKYLASISMTSVPEVPYITTDDALNAFCWKKCITVRHRRRNTPDARSRRANTAYHVQSYESGKSTIAYDGRFNPDTDVASLSVLPWICSQSLESSGDPIAFGDRNFLTSRFSVCFTFFHKSSQGDCDSLTCLTDADIEALTQDPEWISMVEYIG